MVSTSFKYTGQAVFAPGAKQPTQAQKFEGEIKSGAITWTLSATEQSLRNSADLKGVVVGAKAGVFEAKYDIAEKTAQGTVTLSRSFGSESKLTVKQSAKGSTKQGASNIKYRTELVFDVDAANSMKLLLSGTNPESTQYTWDASSKWKLQGSYDFIDASPAIAVTRKFGEGKGYSVKASYDWQKQQAGLLCKIDALELEFVAPFSRTTGFQRPTTKLSLKLEH